MKKTLRLPIELCRAASLEMTGEEGKREFFMSLSSEEPYLRSDWDGEEFYEVLDHGPGGLDDSRLKAGLPILFNHRTESPLGNAKKFENDGKKVRVSDIVWSSSQFAQEKKKDAESGALPFTSVGYRITGKGKQIGERDGIPVIKFKWEIHEGSLAPVPADYTVGPMRNRSGETETKLVEIPISEKEVIDTNTNSDTRTNAGINADPSPNTTKQNMKISDKVRKHLEADTGGNASTGTATIDAPAERKAAVKEFQARCKKIDEFTAALKNPEWRKAAEIVANKHKEAEADFESFRMEANNAISALATKADVESDESRSQIQVIGERGSSGQRALSIGAQFVRSKDFKERAAQTGRRRVITVDTDMSVMGIRGKVQLAQRAGFTSSDLSAINVAPQQTMIGLGMERLTIMDLIAPGTTSAAAIPYPKETSQGTLDGVAVTSGMPRAGMVGERGVKPTWEPDVTTDVANVKKIAVVTKVPDEFLSDFPGFQSYIDQRLPAMVDFQAENQILYGDGIGNNIKGILTNAGVLTRAYATSWATTIKKAITDVEVTAFFTVDAIAMHPYDWEVASLETDVNGQHFAGGPFYIPYGNGVFMEMRTFWGKPVVVTVGVAVGQPVIGCWKLGAQYFMREGMRLETTNSNEDDFKRNLIAVRAEERLALATYRPACFLEVTGGPART